MGRSVRSVRVIAVAAMGLVCLLATSSIVYLHREVGRDQEDALRSLSKSVAQTIDETLGRIDIALQVSVDEIERQIGGGRPDATSITQYLSRQQERVSNLDLLRATNARGEVIYGKGVNPAERSSLAQRDYYTRLRDDPSLGMVISEPIIGRISQKWQWLMARRINHADGGFAGLVYGSIFIDTLAEMFRQVQLSPGSVIALRDEHLKLVARTTFDQSAPRAIGELRMSDGMRAAFLRNRDEGFFQGGANGPDGIDRLIAYRRSAKYGFTVLVGVPVDAAYAGWNRQAVAIGLLAGLLVIGIFFYARRVEQHLSSQLRLARADATAAERNLLRQLISGIPSLVWLKDPRGVYLACNYEFERFFGHPEASIVGRTDFDFMDKDLAEFFREHDRAAASAGKPTVNEEWITYADDGHRALLQTTKTPLLNPDGTLLGVLGIAFDITDLRRKEEALSRSEESLNRAQAVAHIGSWMSDLKSGQTHWSVETYRIFGIDPETPMSFSRLLESVYPPDRAGLEAAWEGALHGSTVFDHEHRIVRSGSLRWVHARAAIQRNAEDAPQLALGTVQDITEERRLRDDLDEALLFLSESQSIARVGGWKVNPETGYLMWTPEVYRLVEHPIDEPINLQSGLVYYSPEDLPLVAAHFESSWQSNQPFVHECRMISRSGREFWAELRCVGRVSHPSGDYLAGTFQDVTERRNAALALDEERRVRETIMESIPGVFYALDAAGRFTFWNRNFERITEWSAPELAGMSALEVFSGDDQTLIAERIRQVFASGEATAEANLLTKSGKVLPYFFTGRRIEMNGVPVLVGAGIDYSAQRTAESALREMNAELERRVEARAAELSEANIRLLDTQFAMEEVGIGITWVDFETGRFIYANRYAAEVLGYSIEEYLQLRVPDIDPNFPDEQFVAICESIRRKGHLTIETEQEAKDGRRVPMEVSVYFHAGREGVPPRMIVFQTEIGARKEIESALRQARDAAEAASRAKSSFVANMSHEIRTPLNAILGLTHLMRAEALTAKQLERLRKMDLAGRHLLSIINDILDLSKIEAGGLLLESGSFPFSNVLESVAEMVRDSAVSKGVELRVERENVPEWLEGDATRLRQALLNYASNAIKFTERGCVTLRAVAVSERRDELTVRFEVVDTGVGLTPEQQSRMFRAFEQADNSTARKYGGTGLGLALTKRLIELMGGRVGLSSEYGKGSTFWFEVPLRHGVVPAEGAPGDSGGVVRRQFDGARVLLAEDNPVNVEVVREMLSAAGITVSVAVNGRDALERCHESSFDLVLMDMQMPEMDGLEATREIRAIPALASLPIIALTANAFAEDRKACFDAGMNDVLTKPVEPVLLYATLDRWLPLSKTPENRAPAKIESPHALDAGEHQTKVDVLRRIPGVDVEQGLRMVRGSSERYLSLIERFNERHGADILKFDEMLAAGNFDSAMNLMHALKGASGMLGFRSMMEEAGALESILRGRGEDALADEQLTRLSSQLAVTLSELTAVMQEQDVVTPPGASGPGPDVVHTVIGTLARMLAEYDIAAQSYAFEHQAVIQAALGSAYASFDAEMNRFAFESALAIVRRLQENGGAHGQ